MVCPGPGENRAMDVINDVMGWEISSPADDAPFLSFTVTATSVRLADEKNFTNWGLVQFAHHRTGR